MLMVTTDVGEQDCSGLRRRDFLRVGALGLGGPSLAGLLAARAAAEEAGRASTVRDKAVVLLFLAGGPSHIETFDPKMSAPDGVRSVVGEIPTSIPGVTFSGVLPKLSARAGRLAVVRTFRHGINDHALAIRHVLTAGNPLGAGMGAVYARLRGATDPRTALPTSGLVSTEEFDGQYVKEKARIRESSGPGTLGAAYGPFDPSAGGGPLDLMRLNMPRVRLESRRSLLESLDEAKRTFDHDGAVGAMDEYERQAFDLILRNAGDALDLRREDPKIVERYDTGSAKVGFKKFRRCTLGRQLLTARRLVEAGCGFVTVQNCGWDMHADGNNPGIEAGMRMLGPPLDHAVAAFLDDVAERGLSEKILLVVTGDFGRTPRINKKGGRDHYAPLSTLALAGGGLKTGQVVGRSTRLADAPADEPVTPARLAATLLHTLFDASALRLSPGVPREIAAMFDAGEPIRELF